MAERSFGNKLRGALLCIVLTVSAAGMIVYDKEIAAEVSETIARCINVLIPSLFAFMAMTDMLIKSGSIYYIAKPFRVISHYIFKIPDPLFTVFLISSVAGYPVGVKALSDMLDRGEINVNTAEKAACFCYCGGPAFYSGAIGLAIFGNKEVGTLIFISVLVSNIIIALVVCRTSELNANSVRSLAKSENILSDSVTSAGSSMCSICMTVVFFSALIRMLNACGLFLLIQRKFGLSDNVLTLIKAFIEITSLTELSGAPYGLLPAICAACSFGGVCIIVQLYAVKSDKMSLFSFIKLRFPAAVLSALICKMLRPYIITEAISAVSYNNDLFKIDNFAASICLLLMIFLLNLKKTLVFSK